MTVTGPGFNDFDAGSSSPGAISTVYDNQARNFGPTGGVLLGPFAWNQPSWELSILTLIPAAATVPWLQVLFEWSDAGTGQIVDLDQTWLAQSSLNQGAYFGRGPARGNQLRLALTNMDPAQSDTITSWLSAISRPYDEPEWDTQSFAGIPGFAVPSLDPASRILASSQVNNGIGATFTRLLPIWTGDVQLCVVPAAGQATTVTVTQVGDQNTLSTGVVAQYQGAAGAPIVESVSLPSAHCTVAVTNTGAAASLTSLFVTKQKRRQ